MSPEDLGKLEVVAFGLTISKDAVKNLTHSKHIGLSIIAGDGLAFLCLITHNKIYVVNPKIGRHVKFLNNQFDRKELTFYIVDGLFEAERFKTIFNIRLTKQIDLCTLDVFLTTRSQIVNSSAPLKKYSLSNVPDQLRVKNHSYAGLVEKYLRFELESNFKAADLESIKRFTLDDRAKDCIRKYSGPIRALAMNMVERYEQLRDLPSKNIYSMASLVPDDIREEYDLLGRQDYSTLCTTVNRCRKVDNSLGDLML